MALHRHHHHGPGHQHRHGLHHNHHHAHGARRSRPIQPLYPAAAPPRPAGQFYQPSAFPTMPLQQQHYSYGADPYSGQAIHHPSAHSVPHHTGQGQPMHRLHNAVGNGFLGGDHYNQQQYGHGHGLGNHGYADHYHGNY